MQDEEGAHGVYVGLVAVPRAECGMKCLFDSGTPVAMCDYRRHAERKLSMRNSSFS